MRGWEGDHGDSRDGLMALLTRLHHDQVIIGNKGQPLTERLPWRFPCQSIFEKKQAVRFWRSS